MKIFKWLAALPVTLALVACGGGGGSAGTVAGVTGETTAVVSSFVYQLSKSALTNSGADSTLLTVTALDSSNNPVSGVKVVVSPDTGIYTPDAGVTDEKGVVTGRLAINPNDKSDRNITSVITVGGKIATVVVPVTGSQISLALVPATPAPGSPVSLDVRVADVNGTVIPNVKVDFSGSTLGFTGTQETGVNGSITLNLDHVPLTPGSYTVVAKGSGVSAVKTVQVVSPTGGTIPDVPSVIVFSPATLSASPSTIAPNVTGSTINRSTLKAIFQDSSNQAIQNVRVRFDVMPPGLGSGEQISTGSTVVYSDVNGEALAEYIAGSRSSPTNGVLIRACYGRTDAELAGGACPNRAQANLTVATSPLSISIGDDNTMERGNDGLSYVKDIDVAVADSAGYAVAGAVLSVSVDIRKYRKAAAFNAIDEKWCPNEDFNRNGFMDFGEDKNRNGVLDFGEDLNGNGKLDSLEDLNGNGRLDSLEDLNANGRLDTIEDINENGTIEPRKADVIVSFVGSNKTDAYGRSKIRVEWAQNFATWLQYTVKVTTNVAGSEGKVERAFETQFIEEDEKNGSFRIPQYGAVLDCSSPD